MTAAGWSPVQYSESDALAARTRIRAQYNIAPDAIVIGIVGSLTWSPTVSYCYGLELVNAVKQLKRQDVHVLIVGDGDGREQITAAAAGHPRIHFTGQVPMEQTLNYMAAMDIASLPQSVDGVGSFRYTTKISEYLAAGVPVVTGQIPLAYDFMGAWLWRLPGDAPWDPVYVDAVRDLLASITRDEIAARAAACPRTLDTFDQKLQIDRATAFIADLIQQHPRQSS